MGRGSGVDLEDLRVQTPAGSLSALSAADADRLIARLRGMPQHVQQGTASDGQLDIIEELVRLRRRTRRELGAADMQRALGERGFAVFQNERGEADAANAVPRHCDGSQKRDLGNLRRRCLAGVEARDRDRDLCHRFEADDSR